MYICDLVFGLEIVMPGIFFGSKISGLCIFVGLQYEGPSDPPVMYTSSTPPWELTQKRRRPFVILPLLNIISILPYLSHDLSHDHVY